MNVFPLWIPSYFVFYTAKSLSNGAYNQKWLNVQKRGEVVIYLIIHLSTNILANLTMNT